MILGEGWRRGEEEKVCGCVSMISTCRMDLNSVMYSVHTAGSHRYWYLVAM